MKILKNALVVSAICLSTSCKFSWDPNPYVGDPTKNQIIRENGETIKCDQPIMKKITCFDEDDISDLISEIDRINSKEKDNEDND